MPDIIHETVLPVPGSTVFRALTTSDGLTAFWTDQLAGGSPGSVGALAELGFGPKREVVTVLRVEALVEPRLVVWSCLRGPDEWAGTKIRWELRPLDAGPHEPGTRVRLEHRGWVRDNGELGSSSFTWAEILQRLGAHVTTGGRDPRFRR